MSGEPWRWTAARDAALNELWSTSLVACCREPLTVRRYRRQRWAADRFTEAHPGCPPGAAYKRLERIAAGVQ